MLEEEGQASNADDIKQTDSSRQLMLQVQQLNAML